jgi:hypothetical protein
MDMDYLYIQNYEPVNDKIKFIFLIISMIFFGILSNVGTAQMAFSMPGYPSFLNYAVGIFSLPFFLTIAWYRGEDWKDMEWKNTHKQYLILALISALNWISLQYVAAWVDGSTQQLLSLINVPAVYLFEKLLTGLVVNKRELISSIFVLIGIGIGIIPLFIDKSNAEKSTHPEWYDAWYFILIFGISVSLQSLLFVCQERVFHVPYDLSEASCLFWYQLYAIPFYVLAIPLEAVQQINALPYNKNISWSFENQLGAFRCFIGKPLAHEFPTQCANKIAWAWVMVYVIGFVGLFFTSAILFKRTTAFWTIVLQSLIAPLSSFVFAIKSIVGEHNYVPFSTYSAISFLVIIIALLLRNKKKLYVDHYTRESFYLPI